MAKRTGAIGVALCFPLNANRFWFGPFIGKHTMDDASKAAWRRQFMRMLHPYLPQMATLIETADKLDGVRSFIDSLSPDAESERDDGVFVGSLAIRYGLKILDHFGFVDGEDAPMPTHLDQIETEMGTGPLSTTHGFSRLKRGQLRSRNAHRKYSRAVY